MNPKEQHEEAQEKEGDVVPHIISLVAGGQSVWWEESFRDECEGMCGV